VASAETRILNAAENFEPLSHKPTNRNSFFARPSFYPIGVCTVNPLWWPADGVVVVPRGVPRDVLVVAEKMDFNEHSMYAYIEKLKSHRRSGQEIRQVVVHCLFDAAGLPHNFESMETYIREQQTLALRRCSQSGKRAWN
jgi:hypothetical protein